MMSKKDYYKAYDERYKIVHHSNELWEYFEKTEEVELFIEKYQKNKNNKILDLGCGEGRDAIYLLDKGYNIEACDYSEEAIKICNKISNNKYQHSFFKLDIFNNDFSKKYNLIYSVCVLHMFVLDEHRKKYLDFIYNHLEDDGYALIIVLGDNKFEKETNVEESFNLERRQIRDLDINIEIPKTSCKIVNRENLNREIANSKLYIEKEWISNKVPGFNTTMCTIVKKGDD